MSYNSGRGGPSDARLREETEETLLGQNDDALDLLSQKVLQMKGVAIDIGNEVNEHNRYLETVVRVKCIVEVVFLSSFRKLLLISSSCPVESVVLEVEMVAFILQHRVWKEGQRAHLFRGLHVYILFLFLLTTWYKLLNCEKKMNEKQQDGMGFAQNMFEGTMVKLKTMVETGNTKDLCYLTLGLFVFLLIVYHLVW